MCKEREKTNKMQQLDVYYQLLSQHVSDIIMPIFRRTKTVLLQKGNIRKYTAFCGGINEDGERKSKK
jgi:hypothetical protein